MGFLIKPILWNPSDEEDARAFASLKKDWNSYQAYLKSIKNRLPKAVYNFATADWHYNPNNRKCPHDAWVREIKITETGKTAGRSKGPGRRIKIELVLIGAYHDRLLKLMYLDVIAYSMTPSKHRTRGDWITDEISLSESGFVVHDIQFADGSLFRFECKNMSFQQRLTSMPHTSTWISLVRGRRS